MTREEAKRFLIEHCNPRYPDGDKTQWDEAINLAISALQDVPDTNDGDMISRQVTIDALNENKEMINVVLDSLTLDYNTRRYQEQRRGQIDEDIDTIKGLPPAQPEQSLEIQDILEYLDTVLHPIVSPDHWNVYSELHDIISMLPPAQPEQQWVPVTERLPEDNTEVWVTTEMLSEVTRACWHKDSNLWCHPYYSDCLLVLRPIAWMEMSFPEPYKGGVQ